MEIEGIEIERECHDCFKVKAGGMVAYFDPFNIKNPEKADLILISHEHYDHLSLEDLEKILKDDTFVFIPPVAHPPLLQLERDLNNLIVMGPGEKYFGETFEVETIPAYNVDKFRRPGEVFHPKEDGRIGFVLTIGGKRVYHAGDTDLIEEMGGLKDIDIALLPVSGKFVMTVEEAARAAGIIKPKVAIPMHWGEIIGTREDAEKFREMVPERAVIV